MSILSVPPSGVKSMEVKPPLPPAFAVPPLLSKGSQLAKVIGGLALGVFAGYCASYYMIPILNKCFLTDEIPSSAYHPKTLALNAYLNSELLNGKIFSAVSEVGKLRTRLKIMQSAILDQVREACIKQVEIGTRTMSDCLYFVAPQPKEILMPHTESYQQAFHILKGNSTLWT